VGDVLLLDGGRDATPWYEVKDLQADANGFVLARALPEDTYVPHEYVIACVTTAVWWHKAVNVSWLQMDFDAIRGCDIPIQHHRKGAAVMYVDDDLAYFAVAGPEDLESPVRVAADCVTDIELHETVPEPLTLAENAKRLTQAERDQIAANVAEAERQAEAMEIGRELTTIVKDLVVRREQSPLTGGWPMPQVDG
jgi:hypothetical protein